VLRLAVPFHCDGDRSRPANVATEPHHRYVAERKRRADSDRAAGYLYRELRRADDRRADTVGHDLERRWQFAATCVDRLGELAAEVVVIGALTAREVLGHAARQGDPTRRGSARARREELQRSGHRRAAGGGDEQLGEPAGDALSLR